MHISISDGESSDMTNSFPIQMLYNNDLNLCVDSILQNKPNHLDMLHQMEILYGCSKRELEQKNYIVRHRMKLSKRSRVLRRLQKEDNSSSNFSTRLQKPTRVRKNIEQQRVLESKYAQALDKRKIRPNQRSNIWEKDEIKELADQVGLSEGQIYKWQWDR